MGTRNANASAKFLVDMKLMLQGMVLCCDSLELKNDVLSQQNVMCEVYFTCILASQ